MEAGEGKEMESIHSERKADAETAVDHGTQAEQLSPGIEGRSEGQWVIYFPACRQKAKWRPGLYRMGSVTAAIVNIYWALTPAVLSLTVIISFGPHNILM